MQGKSIRHNKTLSRNELMNLITSSAHMSISNKCNSACRHCVVLDDDLQLIDANHDGTINWIEQLYECGVKAVNFVGGEPFVVRKNLNNYERIVLV